MSTTHWPIGTVFPLQVMVVDRTSTSAPVTGSTAFRVRARRVSDDKLYDFSDQTWKSSAWTTANATLTEVDATNDPGWYKLAAGIVTTGLSTGEVLLVTYTDTGVTAGNLPAVETVALGVVAAPGDLMGLSSNAITSAKIASGAITSSAFASGAIDAAAIATDAIGSAELSTAAANKIRDTIFPALVALDTTAASGSTSTVVRSAATQADGFFDGATLLVINAAGVATRRITSYANTNGAFTLASALPFTPSASDRCIVLGNVAPGAAATLASGAITSATFASGAITSTAFAANAVDANAVAADAATEIGAAAATATWATALPGSFSSGQAGKIVGDNLNATVGSRATDTSVWSTAVPGAFSAGQAGYVLGTNLDTTVGSRATTGDAMTLTSGERSTVAGLVWDENIVSGHGTASTAGLLVRVLGAAISTRTNNATLNALLGVPDTAGKTIAETVWATVVPGSFASGTAGYNLDAQVSTVGGGSLTVQQIVDGVWNEATSGHNTVGSFGLLIKTDLDATVSSRATDAGVWTIALPGAYTSGQAGKIVGDALDATVSSRATSSSVWATAVPGAYSSGQAGYVLGTYLNAAVGSLPSASTIATTLLDTALSGHTTSGTAGEALSRADVATSSRAAPGAAMTLTSGERDAVQAKILSDATPFAGARIATLALSSEVAATPGLVWDVDIVNAHGSASTAGLLLRAVGAGIAARTNTPTLAGLLNVPDTAGQTVLTAVDTTLTSSHGSGSWATVAIASGGITSASFATNAITAATLAADVTTELQAGLATASGVTSAVAALQTHGDTTWSTATGFSVPGDAMTLTAGERTAVGTAVWATATRTLSGIGSSGIASQTTVDTANSALTAIKGTGFTTGDDLHSIAAAVAGVSPSGIAAGVWAAVEGTPSVGTMGWALYALRNALTNAMRVTTPGTLTLDDDNGQPLLTWSSVRDGNGNAVTLPSGMPAQRNKAT